MQGSSVAQGLELRIALSTGRARNLFAARGDRPVEAPWKIDEFIWVDTAEDNNTPTARDGFALELVTTPHPADGWPPQWWATGWLIKDGVRVNLRTVCVSEHCLVWRNNTWVSADLAGTSTHLLPTAPGRLQIEQPS